MCTYVCTWNVNVQQQGPTDTTRLDRQRKDWPLTNKAMPGQYNVSTGQTCGGWGQSDLGLHVYEVAAGPAWGEEGVAHRALLGDHWVASGRRPLLCYVCNIFLLLFLFKNKIVQFHWYWYKCICTAYIIILLDRSYLHIIWQKRKRLKPW